MIEVLLRRGARLIPNLVLLIGFNQLVIGGSSYVERACLHIAYHLIDRAGTTDDYPVLPLFVALLPGLLIWCDLLVLNQDDTVAHAARAPMITIAVKYVLLAVPMVHTRRSVKGISRYYDRCTACILSERGETPAWIKFVLRLVDGSGVASC